MKKYLNLSMVATFVIATLSYNFANAKNSQPLSIKDKSVSATNSNEDVRVFVNNQQRSLYQIALLSGISITELRELNKGDYDSIDVVKVGDSIVLPANSPLLPAVNNQDTGKIDKYNLPSLGSLDTVDVKTDDSMERQVASVLQTLGQQDWENMTSEKLKKDLNTKTQDYAENYVRNQVHNQVIDPIRSAAQDFLGRFGTAQLQFDISDQAKLNNVNVKLFSPWYDSDNTLIFSQLTYQEYEKDRRIGNFGIGQRWDVADNTWLLGYNVFFDHDFSRNHNRLGLGLEAWSDYMKLAANYYTPLSDWKDSKDFDDYLERAARGFDVRFQGYLPSYPHLGGSLMFEQYFGDKVALFGKDNLQKDPYAVTVGVDYTPVPLFTIKGEHKQGQDANKQAKVELTMNYRLGVPLKDQLDPNMVQVARSLKGSRYDLVDRNNYIVLEYKEKKFSVDLAALGEFEEGQIVPVAIAVRNAKGTLSPLSWNVAAPLELATLASDNGDLCYNRGSAVAGTSCPVGNLWNVVGTNDIANWSILTPDYINATTGQRNPIEGTTAVTGRYTFDVTVTDGNGRTATSNTSWLAVKPSSARQVLLNNVTPIPAGGKNALGSPANPASANGTTSVFLQANLVSSPVVVAPAKSTPIPTGAVTGFHDYFSFSEFAAVAVPAAPLASGTTYTSVTPTKDEITNINALYTATSGGNKVTFVADNALHQCPTATPKCLLVKSISKTVGSGTIADDYQIEVATNAALGNVDVSLKLSSYQHASSPTYGAAPTPTTITFTGGVPAKVTIYNGDNIPVSTASNSNVVTMTGSLTVGDTYTVKVEDSANNDITASSNVTWSLVGNNSLACPAPVNTVLQGDTNPTGDDPTAALAVSTLFSVAQYTNADPAATPRSYTIKGLVTGSESYASAPGKSTSPVNTTITASPPACAGDQGFKLRIDIN